MPGQAERLLHQAEEPVGVADQVVGLPLGDRPPGAGLGRRRLAAPAEKNAAHSASSGDLGQQDPGVLLGPAAPGRPGGRVAQAASRAAVARNAYVGVGVAQRDLGVVVIASHQGLAARAR